MTTNPEVLVTVLGVIANLALVIAAYFIGRSHGLKEAALIIEKQIHPTAPPQAK